MKSNLTMGFIHLAPSKVQKPIFFDLCFVLTIEFEQDYPNIYDSVPKSSDENKCNTIT